MKRSITTLAFLSIWCAGRVFAQEGVAPLGYNAHMEQHRPTVKAKTTASLLPFFEDFTNNDVIPDQAKWTDRSVYVNNTMGLDPVSRGVATFDGLNARGGPYDSVNNLALVYADSLTSTALDLSGYSVGDSLYLSFFYQPQGRGFSPEAQDSLMLYMKKAPASWVKVWAKEGSAVHEFRQVMIRVNDPAYFHNNFQFRFVNKASVNLNDDIWNVDYIRLAENRSSSDTAVNDIMTTEQPTNLLNDYTAMPYRQFTANMNGELASQHSFYARNRYNSGKAVNHGYIARESVSGVNLFTSGQTNVPNMPPYVQQQYQFPVYNISHTAPGPYSKVVFEHKYYISQVGGPDTTVNDTIIHNQIFDNYLAYDDGSAEKSYFLHQGNTLPAKTAIEFHLNQPDTLRGVAIYFGRQVPLASNKFFEVTVYKNIAVNGAQDTVLYTDPFLFTPSYVDTINKFWVYRFDSPVPLAKGTFFLGTLQPAQSGSDSIYFGLDVNRIGGNHLYIDVNGFWESSVVSGAVMIRPLLGQAVIGTSVAEAIKEKNNWTVYPNPATATVSVGGVNSKEVPFEIVDMQGRIQLKGMTGRPAGANVSGLAPGIYFVRILDGEQGAAPKKFIKL